MEIAVQDVGFSHHRRLFIAVLVLLVLFVFFVSVLTLGSRGGRVSPAAARRLQSANQLELSSVRRAVMSAPVWH
jgi:hypothetical protein